MKILKTQDIRTVLYSIVEQASVEDELQYQIICKNKINERIAINKIDKIVMMKQLTKVRKAIDDERTCVVFEFARGITFRIYKRNGYYIIGNWEILLNYIICEMINNIDQITFSVINNQNELKFLKYSLNKIYNFDSIIPEIVAENIQKISVSVKNKLTSYKNSEIVIANENFEFKFSLDEYLVN